MEEKFISIDYKTWHEKYVPMEKEVERLKKELAEKDVEFYLLWHSERGSHKQRLLIKSLDVVFNKSKSSPIYSELGQYTPVLEAVNKAIYDAHRYRYGTCLITHEEAKEYLSKIQEGVDRYTSEVIKNDALLNKINSIPRWKRWLFGIKHVS